MSAANAPLEVTLSNPRADRVRRVRALAGAPVRKREGRFLVEGPQGVREAVRFAATRIRDVYVTPDAAERHPEIVREAQAAGVYVHGCSDEVSGAMSKDAQGVLAVVEAVPVPIEEAFATGRTPVIVLSDVRDPGNLGVVIRTADVAGAGGVICAGDCVEATNPKVVRATAGSLFHLPVVEGPALVEAVEAAHEGGMRVLAADGSGDVVLGEAGADAEALSRPTAWAFGNEAHGLAPEALALADAVVRIPILGHAESLNLATAVAVCLYAGLRR